VADVSVRPAQKSDVRALSRTLGRAFYDDPIMMWTLPDSGQRATGLPRLFAMMTRCHFLAGGGVEIATNGSAVGAATLWDPPGRWKHTRLEELLMMPAFIWAYRFRVQAAQQVAEVMKAEHPEEPHWYLCAIGSDPTVRGAGYGQALMRSRLDRCDGDHAPAYLEATKQQTVPYYMRFGFQVTGEIELPDGGPAMWPMWREPR
jgi:ribosomal protein S18 acetylase RimI-like enzyme